MDELQRYLRQQAELGSKRVLLSEPAASLIGRDAPAMPDAAPALSDAAPMRAAEPSRLRLRDEVTKASPPATSAPAPAPQRVRTVIQPSASPTVTETAGPKWKKDAPAIYPVGNAVLSPAPELLAGELDALTTLDEVAAHIATCRRCALCAGRTNTVPGEGNPKARLLCVGEGPGENEDLQGRPFIGKAGELLTDILKAIDLPRETIFIANVVKCRPPQNRKPLPDESSACLPYLRRQIAILQPKVILALGSTAAEALLGRKSPLGEMRGKVHTLDGTPLVVTYHPAALLRNPNWKKPTWDDVRVARQLLDG